VLDIVTDLFGKDERRSKQMCNQGCANEEEECYQHSREVKIQKAEKFLTRNTEKAM
jgi:hypothetical protein